MWQEKKRQSEWAVVKREVELRAVCKVGDSREELKGRWGDVLTELSLLYTLER